MQSSSSQNPCAVKVDEHQRPESARAGKVWASACTLTLTLIALTVGGLLTGCKSGSETVDPPGGGNGAALGFIAFMSDRTGNREIFVMDSDGANPRNLTRNGASDTMPAWSPDGKKILFISNRDGNEEVYVMRSDGSNQKNLTRSSRKEFRPAWSPDGTQIVFDDNSEIYSMNPDGTNVINLTNSPFWDDRDASWSPDSGRIAFSSVPNGAWSIWVMNYDGTSPYHLIGDGGGGFGSEERWMPDWAPFGDRLAFHAVDWGIIHEINLDLSDGKSFISDTYLQDKDADADWSPDGNRLAFERKAFFNGEWDYEIFTVNASNGKDARNISNDIGEDMYPAWQPR